MSGARRQKPTYEQNLVGRRHDGERPTIVGLGANRRERQAANRHLDELALGYERAAFGEQLDGARVEAQDELARRRRPSAHTHRKQ